VPGGQACTLQGWDPLPAGDELRALAAALLGASPQAERRELWDEERASYRFALIEEGRLASCLLIAGLTAWPLPERDAIVPLLGAAFDEAARASLMSMQRAAAATWMRSRTVCACLSVSEAVIDRAIAERARSAAEIGAVTGAGTNCGSCLPEIEAMLRERKSQAA
jgi:assimilatory nitrate reductase catalytic subunit